MVGAEGVVGDCRFRAIFEAALDAMLLVDDDRRYVEANPAACQLLGRDRTELLGLRIEDVSARHTDVRASWDAFLRYGEASGEYDVVRPDGATVAVEFRAKANVLPRQHLSIMRDITARKRLEQELQEVNERLRRARDRDRRVALALQQAMLPAAVTVSGVDIATRYLPAARGIRVCGDWYDVVDLGAQRVGVAVGDVMGHGLAAAGTMGQLRSALAAAMHAEGGPAQALSTVDRYARSLGTDLLATVVHAVLDLRSHTLTYSSAGHPPGLLADRAGGVCFLDRAAAPPLAAAPSTPPRPEVRLSLPSGATLVLFTDGLVERRFRDIDDGLRRLSAAVARHGGLRADALASAILDELRADASAADDIALVVIRLCEENT